MKHTVIMFWLIPYLYRNTGQICGTRRGGKRRESKNQHVWYVTNEKRKKRGQGGLGVAYLMT